jgi:hypothetical protein
VLLKTLNSTIHELMTKKRWTSVFLL